MTTNVLAEEWRAVIGYEGFYEISDHARIRSLPRMVPTKGGGLTLWRGKILKPCLNSDGYLQVGLTNSSGRKSKTVHQLLARAFIGEPPPGMQVNHKDGVKTNNRIGNFEYTTSAGNTRHAIALGLINNYGENSTSAKLTNAEVVEIKQLRSSGVTLKRIAEKFQVATGTVHRIVNGKQRCKDARPDS